MRLYLQQLRRVRYSPSDGRPGPLGSVPSGRSGLQFVFCPRGLFSMVAELEAYFRKEHSNAEWHGSRGSAPSPDCQPLDASAFASLVFAHSDLNIHNILLDARGVLWTVDWGWAGFYPPWFEYFGMRFAAKRNWNPESWLDCIEYMAEPALKYEEWMRSIGYCYTNLPKPDVRNPEELSSTQDN